MARRREEAGFGEIGEFELMGALLDLMGPLLDLALEAGIGILQLRRHAVELLGERFELVSSFDRDPLVEIAAANARGASAYRLDRNDHPAREEQAGQEGKREAGQQQRARA